MMQRTPLAARRAAAASFFWPAGLLWAGARLLAACSADEVLTPGCAEGQVLAEGRCADAPPAGAGGAPAAGAAGAGAVGAGAAGNAGQGGGAAPVAPRFQVPPGRVNMQREAPQTVRVTLAAPAADEVTVSVEGLPEGAVAVEPLTIAAGAREGDLTLRAAPDAVLGTEWPARVRARAGGLSAEAELRVWVQGAPGVADSTFAINGYSYTSIPLPNADGPRVRRPTMGRVDVDPAGQVFVYGSFASEDPSGQADPRHELVAWHFSPAGIHDVSFGSNGRRVSTLGASFERSVSDVWPQPDGALLVVGGQADDVFDGVAYEYVGPRVLAGRLLGDLGLDPSFGQSGVVSTPVTTSQLGNACFDGAPSCIARRAAPTAEGGVVVAGPAGLFKITPIGTLDAAFGTANGRTPASDACRPVDVAIAPNGDLVAAGFAVVGLNDQLACAMRFTAAGVPVASFGTNGVRVLPKPAGSDATQERAYRVAVTGEGGVVVGIAATKREGGSFPIFRARQGVARLLPTGAVDPAFGTAGRTLPFTVDDDTTLEAHDTLLEPGGSVVSLLSANGVVYLLRHDAKGGLDAGFGTGGVGQRTVAGTLPLLSLKRQPDGRLVAGGVQREDSNALGAAVLRFWP